MRLKPSNAAISIVWSLFLLTSVNGQAVAGEIADTFKKLLSNPIVSRQIDLKQVGIRQPIGLNVQDSTKEFYLPVPPDVPLIDASLALDSHYMRPEGGRTTFIVSLDGYAVSSRSLSGDNGDASLSIGVDGSPRPNGFVRLGLKWSSIIDDNVCHDELAIGNIVQVMPSTTLSYSFDSSKINSLYTAWMALPQSVKILISGKSLSKDSYDSAWRIGVALERAGKDVSIISIPQQGDTVDLSELNIPQELLAIPAFAALSSGDTHTLSSPQEAAAFLLMSLAGGQADIALVDDALVTAIDQAFSNLADQVRTRDPEAEKVFTDLRKSQFSAIPTTKDAANSKAIHFGALAGRYAITIGSQAGGAASGLFDRFWRQTAVTSNLIANKVVRPTNGADNLSRSVFGSTSNTLDIIERGSWNAAFDLADVGVPGKVPGSVDLDLVVSPGASEVSPVVAVYLNDYLLGAKKMNAQGNREKLTAWIPAYALLPRNMLRVEFLRQRYYNGCKERPQAYPVAVLPSSRFNIKAGPEVNGFATLIGQLAGNTTLFVPQKWMSEASTSLPGLIRIASVSGIAPQTATLSSDTGAKSVKPEGPFIAFDTAVEGLTQRVDVQNDRLVLTEKDGSVLYDVTGLNNLAVVQVASGTKQPGLIYKTVGSDFLKVDEPFMWGRGTIAVIGKKGLLAQVDTNSDDDLFTTDEEHPLSLADPYSWFKHLPWITAVVVASFLLLLLRARSVRRRKEAKE
ncbi:hypothetical protein WJT86_03840 [Microvirga sp. W0021]|uniref:Cyclic di-GMP-binding protein n=1 Tax=Hohaiivirga grylli TaxID=3133970 RepID=A0ABV0BIV8_9HYPH